MRFSRWWTGAAMGALVLLSAACADGGGEDAETPASEEAAAVELESRPEVADLVPGDGSQPPSELQLEDLAVGDGRVAAEGDVLVVQYVGVRWSDGGVFDASWDRGQPFEFQLGAGQVITGWEQGLEGMQVGGRRVITIPPDLAYGDRGAGEVIPPDETIVFVVDLLETRDAP
ncbi:MAG: FKBP-type peptidyl-prolyl cis-trans isomerase [Nitriliruptoraceae bacterium]